MEVNVGDKFLHEDNYTVLNVVEMNETTMVMLPFNNNEFGVKGPVENAGEFFKNSTKLTESEWRKRIVAFTAWKGTKDQDDDQPETYITDYESFWTEAPDSTVNSFFEMQGHK